jgi:adenylate kinase
VTAPKFGLFSRCGVPAKTKLVCLGAPDENLMSWARSLNLEHVSPAELMRPEISRRPGPAGDEATLAAMRRWFFARKPEAGFVLTDFPATLLQAKVFDEWLEARAETLDAAFASPPADAGVIEHYRTHGLLITGPDFAAA